jgi:ABC-type dipeptide/oligopeptide/nickel transport system ATPase component
MKITLPTKKGNPNTNPEIEFEQLVVVGANGSGKTRFGSHIEEKYLRNVHRISAQKSLSFPAEVSPKSRERATKEFLYGYYFERHNEQQQIRQKTTNRWGSKPSTFLLNDFEKLLILLHTEEYEDSLSYKEGRIEKPITKLDIVQKIWETVLPHRKLIKKAGVIETYPTGQTASNYNATEMSDGERVIFYLIGEVVCAPQNSIIIIDEPEMHIHKSLVKNLFDLIENERQDCSFIYLTHDIDFAFSRQNAIKVWAKSYEGSNVWDYELLKDESPIPEQLYLEILGSRKPVIFLEGDNSSIDYELYEQVYFDHTLKPLGSCEKVIHSVKSFNEQNGFHHIESFGIIDRDRRIEDDVVRLNSKSIWVLDVAESENLLLLEEIVYAVAKHMGKDPFDVFNQVKDNLIKFFNSQLESQILLHFKETLRKKFIEASNFSKRTISDVLPEIDSYYSSIDKQQIFDDIKSEFENIVNSKDYNGVLRVFNLKNALIPNSKVCELTDVKNKIGYLKLVITLLKKKDAESQIIATAIDDKIIKNATQQRL